MAEDFVRLVRESVDLLFRRLDVSIDGVEITQAIQYYHAKRHLSDPSQHGLDNSVPLVAGKPALVRVYLRNGLRSIGTARVVLELKRRGLTGAYHTIAKPPAEPPGHMIPKTDPPYDQERGDMRTLSLPRIPGSLNFVIPAQHMSGSLQFHVTVYAGSVIDGVFYPDLAVDTRDIHIDVHLRQTLHLRSIMVGYSGPTSSKDPAPLFLSPPSYPSDLLTTAAATLIAFPVQSAAEPSSAGWITCDVPLDDAAGCSPNWDALLAKLVTQRTADGNKPDVIYYGLLPTQIPFHSSSDLGCERSGMGAGRVDGKIKPSYYTDGGRVMAHHVGHACGLLHAPGVDDFDALDPNYPAYPPYDPIGLPKGSLGEYGVQMGAAIWITLARSKDVMGSTGWRAGPSLSLYHYGRLLENPMLHPVFTGGVTEHLAGAPKWAESRKLERVVSIIGRMVSDTELIVTSVMRVETRVPAQEMPTSGLTATLRNHAGAALAEAPVRMLTSPPHRDCECRRHGPRFPCVVQALIPDVERGAILTITNERSPLWTAIARPSPPSIAQFEATLDNDRHELTVRWRAQAEQAREVWLQWSEDEGATWHALATGLCDESAAFDTAALPAGPVLIRLLVSDGFDTERSKPVRVDLPRRPPVISILTPGEGETLIGGGTMRLWGAVTVNGRNLTTVEHARWSLDGAPVSEELDTFCLAPPAGEHVIELTVTIDGWDARASRRFLTEAVVEQPESAQAE